MKRAKTLALGGGRLVVALTLLGSTACDGLIGEAGQNRDVPTDAANPSDPNGGFGTTAMRRLSLRELGNTLESVVGFRPRSLDMLPFDSASFGFDRVSESQSFSRAHLDGYRAVATEVADRLMNEPSLDDLLSACPDEAIPALAAPVMVEVTGTQLALGPDWAVQPGADPTEARTLYAPNPEARYTHNFETPGRYEVTLALDTNATVDAVEVRFDDNVVHTATALSGPTQITITLEVETAGSHVLTYQLDTQPSNAALEVDYIGLSFHGPLASGPPADPAAQEGCAAAIVDELAPRAFRRPLTTEQRDGLWSLYTSRRTADGGAQAMRSLLQSVFMSPHFIYLVELGEPVGGHRFELDAWEMANRLSYAFCEMPPDAELVRAAAEGELESPEAYQAQAERLLTLPCGQATVRHFFEQWLWLDRLPGLNKSTTAFPAFTDEARDGMVSEATQFIDQMVHERESDLAAFFSSDIVWPDPRSSFIYGEVEDEEGQTYDSGRAGILTLPATLAVTGSFEGTSPVKRGVFVLEQVLCQHLPPPPADLEIAPPPPDPNLTTRERWEQHSSDPTCASCHQLIDPVGFAFENFDGIGRERTEDQGLPINSEGGIPSIGVPEGDVEGGVELAVAIADSDRLPTCAASQWLRFTLGRLDTEADETTLDNVANSFTVSSIRDALISIVATDAFSHRQEQP